MHEKSTNKIFACIAVFIGAYGVNALRKEWNLPLLYRLGIQIIWSLRDVGLR